MADDNNGNENKQRAIKYFNSGVAKKIEGDIPGAIKDFTKSIELYPNFLAYTYRGNVYGELGNYQQLLVDHYKAINL